MNFKYYDLLSNLAIGIVALFALWKYFFPDYEISEWVVLPAGYVIGYIIDALSSYIEPLLFISIGGKPSDKFLTPVVGRKWTGIKKIRFYFPDRAVETLKKDIGDEDASTDKMFGYAMLVVNSNKDSRVPDFNGHYALSRVILTTLITTSVFVWVEYYSMWYIWFISVAVLLLAWNRYKERAYYYAREVLTEYLKQRQ